MEGADRFMLYALLLTFALVLLAALLAVVGV